MKYKAQNPSQEGFTIVELLIATLVFSMVLLVIIYGVLSFSHAYFTGVNSSATQTSARTIINSVSQAIEFSGNIITPTTVDSAAGYPPGTYYFCAGNTTYLFVQGAMYDGATPTKTDPGLFSLPGTCTSDPFSKASAATAGKELLTANMRIPYLDVAQADVLGRLYSVGASVVYGESDLLCNVSKNGSAGGCQPGDAQNGTGVSVKGSGVNDVVCRQVTGSQFCAHAGLATTVSLRVANNELAP
jgi:type II secretory pathway pseudopilin PulG